MEIESYNRQIKTLSQKGKTAYQDEINFCKGEIMIRLDHYIHGTGNTYDKYGDISRAEKKIAIKLFESFQGHSWKQKFGWTGQTKSSVRPLVKTYEAEAGLFDGLNASKLAANSYILNGFELTNNGCEGRIPSGMGGLNFLKNLDVNYNNLTGPIPSDLGDCERLEFINASGNLLSGELDGDFLSRFQTLRILDLSFNKLEGTLPDAFSTLSKIQDLNLAGNSFTGVLPPSMSALTNLRQLKLYSNQLSGDLPTYLSRMDKMLELNLSQNRITGSFEPLTGCTRLKKITLSHNQLSAPLTENLSALRCLELLYLDHNEIKGTIPPQICELSALKYINISNNQLEGRLPDDFGDLLGLKVCLLSKNYLCGPMPISVAKLRHLREFQLFTALPAGSMTQYDGFTKHNFERVNCWGGRVGIDNVSWIPAGMDDIGNIFNPDIIPRDKKMVEDEEEVNSDEWSVVDDETEEADEGSQKKD